MTAAVSVCGGMECGGSVYGGSECGGSECGESECALGGWVSSRAVLAMSLHAFSAHRLAMTFPYATPSLHPISSRRRLTPFPHSPSPRPSLCAASRECMHTRVGARAHVHTHARSHTRTCKHAHACAHARTHTHKRESSDVSSEGCSNMRAEITARS